MSGFEQLLLDLKGVSHNKTQQGTFFELLMKKYFLTCPLYSEIFESVWLWSEFPYNGGKHDTGIDLVAKKKDFEEYVAIQCKFYDEDTFVSKANVDTFLSASGRPFFIDGRPLRYIERLIVSSTDKWTSTAEETIDGQLPPVTRIRLKDLKDSGIDWDSFSLTNINDMRRDRKKQERPHQLKAIEAVLNGFQAADRGKLVMACGTGKTLTALKIAEAITQGKGSILFLVPSISLLNQTLLEWSAQCKYDYSVFAICSDPKASQSNSESGRVSDTIIPATTNVDRLTTYYSFSWSEKGLKLFFSTYQSIDVISSFQKQTGLVFDLVICDEAHRTTGVTLAGEDESDFVKVHNDTFIRAKKRLYMTATPRIYGDESKTKANEKSALLCSMDDEEIYGQEFYRLGFSESVALGLLSDYKVIVLAVDENYVSRTLQNLITTHDSELILEDAVKIIGCLNGLSKRIVFEGEENYFANDPAPMKRAVAFNSSIATSKKFVSLFREIQDELKLYGYDDSVVSVELDHVDGTNNALFRKDRIDWLKESTPDGQCRVLSNARCLTEGIDVPALDAVMFLNPRNSIVDIIQSVGRVMRQAEGKKYGYIILPVGIPAGREPEEALADNKRYKIVWDVLQALRAHDDRFNNTINKIDLNRKKPDNIQIIGVSGGDDDDTERQAENREQSYTQLRLNLDDLQKWKNSIYAKIVKKCGSRRYWETWAKDIADIANRHIDEIKLLIKKPEIASKFNEFLVALQSNLNSSIDQQDAIEMLAEHMITKPVFDALFENYEFIKSNPVSIIMQDMLAVLDEKALDKEQATLDKFYLSVHERAKGIDNAEGKQKIIIELYEQFFKNALPKQVAKLGIVYTPIEVVDFILQSVEVILKEKFGRSINDDGIHVLDPFTGTGTFIVRLLRSGLISPERLLYKYTNELHANEIVLLAYYIAAINIEETFHDLTQNSEYIPFDGIVLTDTFALSESISDDSGATVSPTHMMFSANSARATKQLAAPITVILGNPPYSAGQKSWNDDNQNVSYKNLDKSLADSYAAKSKATLKRKLYDPYIRAFRWATDRLGDNGVIGFVSNGGFLVGDSFDGFRQCLLEDFNSVYCFDLRGDQRTSGELSRKEGGKIFGSGSRARVCITILVKKKGAKKDGFVRYYDIGDYLTREQKLSIIAEFSSIKHISWRILTPNKNNDWINQRNPNFMNFIALGDKKKREQTSIFLDNYSSGLSTNRDTWVYSFSGDDAVKHAQAMIAFYNSERIRCHAEFDARVSEGTVSADPKVRETFLQNIQSNDTTRISWSSGLHKLFCKNEELVADDTIRTVAYRPYCKKKLVYNKSIIERPSRWDNIFPDLEHDNLVICVSGAPLKRNFSVLMTDCIQDLHFLENSFCLPLYFYERDDKKTPDQLQFNIYDLLSEAPKGPPVIQYKRRHAISDAALKKFREIYGNKVEKDDIFYYLYAVLQSRKYIELYGDNLSKEMPRIPMLDKFPEYVRIGRELAVLHLHYEQEIDPSDLGLEVIIGKPDYNVEKMCFAKEGKSVRKDTIFFNRHITITNIPKRAYEYIVNGKSAIEWVMERYAVTIDKASGIVDDPNLYGDEKYIYNLLISVIILSIKTQDLIDSLPEYKEI